MKPQHHVLTALLSLPLSAAETPVEVMPVAPPPPAAAQPGLIGSSWVVEEIGKKEVLDKVRTFIRFDSAEQVSGSGGINRFGGTCTLVGDKLGFGPLRVTRMAGPPDLMDQEAKFLAALAKVTTYQLDEKDRLHLFDKDGKELARLSRSDGAAGDPPAPPAAPDAGPDER